MGRLKGSGAKKSVGVAGNFVGPAFSGFVGTTAAGAAVLGVVVAQNELKLLYALLRESRANGVDGVVDGIRAVNTDHGSTGACAADAQAAVRSGADGGRNVASGLRIREREIDITAPVNGKVGDLALLNGLRDIGFGCFDVRGLANYFDGLYLAMERQLEVTCDAVADSKRNRRKVDLEIRSTVDTDLVLARRESDEVVAAGII